MTVATTYEHITLNSTGISMIEGTTTKVVEIVMEVKAYGWSPEEIHFQHPYLSLGQIHSALAYYWDNKDSIEPMSLGELKKLKRSDGIQLRIRFKRNLKTKV